MLCLQLYPERPKLYLQTERLRLPHPLSSMALDKPFLKTRYAPNTKGLGRGGAQNSGAKFLSLTHTNCSLVRPCCSFSGYIRCWGDLPLRTALTVRTPPPPTPAGVCGRGLKHSTTGSVVSFPLANTGLTIKTTCSCPSFQIPRRCCQWVFLEVVIKGTKHSLPSFLPRSVSPHTLHTLPLSPNLGKYAGKKHGRRREAVPGRFPRPHQSPPPIPYRDSEAVRASTFQAQGPKCKKVQV